MLKKYDKLLITCNENIDIKIFDLFCEKVVNNFNCINQWFNVKYNSLSLSLISKNNLNLIVKKKSVQYKNIDVPEWLVGFSDLKEVWVVIPTSATLEELYKVAIHELVHLISYKLDTSNKRIKLLDEGIAVFLSNQYAGKIYTPWVNAYLKNNLPKVSYFCTYDVIEFSQKRWISILLCYYKIYFRHLREKYFSKMVTVSKRIYATHRRNR